MTEQENASSLAVVIPSYGRPERLPPLVRVYAELGAAEIVIVLDGPHPGVRDALLALGVDQLQVLELPENVGLALARIRGLEQCESDVVLLADDDVVPASSIVQQHLRHHASGKTVVVGYMPVGMPGRSGRDQAPTRLYLREYEDATRLWERDPQVILDGLWGGAVSVRRSHYVAAEQLKPSTRLAYYEDLDLGLRLRRTGAEAVFDREIRNSHRHARSFDAYLREAGDRGASVRRLEERWGDVPPQIEDLVDAGRNVSRSRKTIVRVLCAVPRPLLILPATGLYRIAGALRIWPVQDAICRLLRRVLARAAYLDAVQAAR